MQQAEIQQLSIKYVEQGEQLKKMQQEIDVLRREKQSAVDAALQKGSADISNRLSSYMAKAPKGSSTAAHDIDHRLASAWGTPSSNKRVSNELTTAFHQ